MGSFVTLLGEYSRERNLKLLTEFLVSLISALSSSPKPSIGLFKAVIPPEQKSGQNSISFRSFVVCHIFLPFNQLIKTYLIIYIL